MTNIDVATVAQMLQETQRLLEAIDNNQARHLSRPEAVADIPCTVTTSPHNAEYYLLSYLALRGTLAYLTHPGVGTFWYRSEYAAEVRARRVLLREGVRL